MTEALSTKDRLIRAAARLFQQQGYNGVGLADILAEAQAPKGSLYHHFPNGKADLAIAAATWASDQILRVIAAAFAEADTLEGGFATLCHKLAKLFDLSGGADGCPIAGPLFEAPDNPAFRDHAAHLYDGWIAEVEAHGQRLGLPADAARHRAETMLLLLEGGWVLARARQDSDVLRALPDKLPT